MSYIRIDDTLLFEIGVASSVIFGLLEWFVEGMFELKRHGTTQDSPSKWVGTIVAGVLTFFMTGLVPYAHSTPNNSASVGLIVVAALLSLTLITQMLGKIGRGKWKSLVIGVTAGLLVLRWVQVWFATVPTY